jgi:hypothetical protein
MRILLICYPMSARIFARTSASSSTETAPFRTAFRARGDPFQERMQIVCFLSYRFDDDSPCLFAHIDNLVEIKLHGFHDSRRDPDRRAITLLPYGRFHDNPGI